MAADLPDTPPPEVVCRGLTLTYPGGTEVLRPLDLTLEAGRTTALVGPSGCGKSSLLRLIAGLESPTDGTVSIGGAPPAETLRRAGLSVAFQDPSLLPWRTVRGNILLALRLARRPIDRTAVDELIALVGLEGFEDTRPAALSGGMRQRAAIARAMATGPGLLLLDEPFGAVDEITRRQLAHELPRLWQARRTTTLLVTHSVAEAVALSDRVVVLSRRPATVVADIAVPKGGSGRDPATLALIDRVTDALTDGGAASGTPLAAQ